MNAPSNNRQPATANLRPNPGSRTAMPGADGARPSLVLRGALILPRHVLIPFFATLLCASALRGQERAAPAAARPPAEAAAAGRPARPGPKTSGDYGSDVVVVRDAQEQALEQARDLHERAELSAAQLALDTAVKEMERATALLEEAKKSPDKLPAAVAAEQAAYQALLKLAAREYRVSRNRNGQRGGQQGERAQRQIDQLDLKQTENRYEMQRQASPQQNAGQREQLQVMNRLKELAQRQQDLNARLKELQTALQEAKTEEEREAIRRRLKRLREEEQEMLADMDELRQRMEKPENQSRMSDARQQLDQTRSDVQRASESLDSGSVPQALTAGTRAQRQLQQIADDFRKKTSSQFADQMREMRNEARQLAQKQEELAKQLEGIADAKRKTLSDSDQRKDLAAQLGGQKAGLTNLFNQMRGVSEQAETAEPLLSKELYDTLRQSNQEELNKSLDLSAELIQRGFAQQAGQFEQRARQSIDELKRSVEKAAESVLGDDVEALRLAKRELDALSQQLEKELSQADTNSIASGVPSTNGPMQRRYGIAGQERSRAPTTQDGAGDPGSAAKPSESAARPGQGDLAHNSQTSGKDSPSNPSASGERQNGSEQQAQNGSPGSQSQRGGQDQPDSQQASSQSGDSSSPGSGNTASASRSGARNGARGGGRRNFYEGGDGGGGPEGGGFNGGVEWPLTGDNYVDWSDRLRDVEEMLDLPELRTEVARVRDRARALRFQYKRHGEKPDWAVVRLQMVAPLAEVRSRIGEELARRESKEAVVPIDRDPVPTKFSELVRRYYEQLGKSD